MVTELEAHLFVAGGRLIEAIGPILLAGERKRESEREVDRRGELVIDGDMAGTNLIAGLCFLRWLQSSWRGNLAC